MFSPEQFCYEKFLGVRKEHPTNLAAVTLMVVLSNSYAKRTGLEVRGHGAAEGARLYIFNHLDHNDIFRLMNASIHTLRGEDGKPALGRIPRALAKSTLFGIAEPDNVREETGKKDILNPNNPFTQAFIRLTVGSFLYGNGFIPLKRGIHDRSAGNEIIRAFSLGQSVASALNGTRDKTGGLNGLRTGAALLIKINPDIPFQLIGVSKEPHMVNIGIKQTYADIKAEKGDLNLRDLTMLLADGTIKLLPERIQERWQDGERQAAYETLYPRRARIFATSLT